MNKLGSEFLEDFKKEEKPFLFQFTVRQLLFGVGMILSLLVLTILIYVGYPDLLVGLIGLFCLAPTVIFGLSFDRKFSLVERLYFAALIKRRLYQTELTDGKEYSISDFIQEKNTKETDTF